MIKLIILKQIKPFEHNKILSLSYLTITFFVLKSHIFIILRIENLNCIEISNQLGIFSW